MNMLNARVIEVLRMHSIKTAWSVLHPFPIPLDLLCLAALRGEEATDGVNTDKNFQADRCMRSKEAHHLAVTWPELWP